MIRLQSIPSQALFYEKGLYAKLAPEFIGYIYILLGSMTVSFFFFFLIVYSLYIMNIANINQNNGEFII